MTCRGVFQRGKLRLAEKRSMSNWELHMRLELSGCHMRRRVNICPSRGKRVGVVAMR